MIATGSIDAVLRQSTLFSSLDDDELRELGRLATTLSVPAEAVVFKEGEPGSELFVVLSGTVRLSTMDAGGRVQPTALLGLGQVFGEMAVLDGSTRSTTATSTADSTLARIGTDDLVRLATQFPGSQAKILREGIRLVSSRLRSSNGRFWDFAGNAMRQKRQLTEARATFLSLVSHELRTPLAIIKSSAQLMRRSPSASPEGFLDKIIAESNHLAMLVDDLIMFSALQSDAVCRDWSKFDAATVARKSIHDLRKAADERDVRLSFRSSVAEHFVSGDPTLIGRALHHLIDNAIKFSPRSSEVVVRLDDYDGARTRLSVIDQGEGIAAGRLAGLLESFVQAEGPLNRNVEGMGIGLSLVDEVVRAHGGRLLVDSTPGRGSTFTIALPLDAEPESLQHPPSKAKEKDHGTDNEDTRCR